MTIRNPHYFGDHFPDIVKHFMLPVTLHVEGDVGSRDGLASNGAVIGEFLATNYVESGVEYDDSAAAGSQFTDVTADLNATGTEEFFTQADEVNDAIYFGDSNPFGGLLVDMNTAGTGSGAVTWEYLNSVGTWVNLATAHELIDDSASFTTGTGNYVVSWKVPSDWAKASIGDAGLTVSDKYWVRARVTTATYTVSPIVDSIVAFTGIDATGHRVPFDGYLERVDFTVTTTEADDDDIEVNVWNATRGTYATVTLNTTTNRVGGAALSYPTNGLYFQRGDELVVQAVTTATNGPTDVNLQFEFRV